MLAWVVVAGCSGSHGVKDVAYADAAIPGVGTVTWSTRHRGKAHVEYGHDALDQRTPDVDAAAGRATVLELEAASDYRFRVVVEDGDRSWASEAVDGHVQAPGTLANSLVDAWNPDLACEDGGYFLFTYLSPADSGSGVAILDRAGKYVWVLPSTEPGVQYTRARLGRDGHSVLWNTNDWDRVADVATIERRSIDGAASTTTRTRNGHHDFVELPDGDLA
jgi:hypothetical protein